MPRIECPYCGAYATKIPGPTLPFHIWEKLTVDFRTGAIWSLPLDTKLGTARARIRELEHEVSRLKRIKQAAGKFRKAMWQFEGHAVPQTWIELCDALEAK